MREFILILGAYLVGGAIYFAATAGAIGMWRGGDRTDRVAAVVLWVMSTGFTLIVWALASGPTVINIQ